MVPPSDPQVVKYDSMTAHHTYIITQKYLSTSDRFFDPQLKVLNATANNTHPPQLFAA